MIRAAAAGLRAAVLAGFAFLATGAIQATSALTAEQRSVEREREAVFHTVAWRLTKGNAPYCANTWPSIGLKLQGAATPGSDSRAITVLAVAPGSPSEDAGLVLGQDVLAINGEALEPLPLDGRKAQEALSGLHRTIETTLDQKGELALSWLDATGARRESTITAIAVCPSRFLTREGKKIGADGVNIRFGLEFAGFGYPEEELAAAVAHELAHNLMGHPYWLDREGRKRQNIRLTEREADRLMPWLLANAGYDPAAAVRFMERWGPRHGGGLFRKRTHDGWDERVEFIEAELALIAPLWEAHGSADWRTHFQPEEGL